MPPKGQIRGVPAAKQQPGNYAQTTLNAIRDPENRTVVIAVSFFAAGVAFLHSSWSEILLPPI
ncbi:hypothetical protein LTR95_014866 [Oleoguttula sp. CCFEE 5521]|nr:hypothetical protein B0A51_18380 [Rachicladosporium sp. CCFEE 5018]